MSGRWLRMLGGGIGVALTMVVFTATAASASTSSAPPSSPAPSTAGVVLPTHVATPAPASGPQLSIAVDNGRTSAAVGDKMSYTVTIHNLGASDVTGLVITQTVPGGLKFTTADSGGALRSGTVQWKLNLKAAQSKAFHTTMTVVATPDDLLRLATVACATMASRQSPIVCASHSDQLPAGAAAAITGSAGTTAAASAAGSPGRTWWYVSGAVVLVLAAGVVVVLLVRRRRASMTA